MSSNEKNIESIAASLAIIAESMQVKIVPTNTATTLPETSVVVPAPVQSVFQAAPAPTFTTEAPSAPAFAPPAFDTVAPTQGPLPTIQLPFSDTAGFTQYLIASFQKLEAKAPGTGGNIQRVIESLGCKNVNEVQPGSWAAVYAEVEKLVA